MRIFCICIVSAIILTWVIPKIATFQDCGSDRATLFEVGITGCFKNKCNFSRNENISVNMVFMPREYVEDVTMTLTARFYFEYGNVSVKLMREDGCDCCMKCPMEQFKNVTINKHVAVPNQLPRDTKARLVWKLVDNKSNILTCVTYLAFIN